MEPIWVPTSKRVRGSIRNSRMIKGMERKIFTKNPSTSWSGFTGRIPPSSVTTKITPRGIPIRYASPVDHRVI